MHIHPPYEESWRKNDELNKILRVPQVQIDEIYIIKSQINYYNNTTNFILSLTITNRLWFIQHFSTEIEIKTFVMFNNNTRSNSHQKIRYIIYMYLDIMYHTRYTKILTLKPSANSVHSWRSPSLSELTPMVFNTELTH